MSGLADSNHASHLHNRRFPRPLRKCSGPLPVGVSAGEHFAVFVENLRFEMMVLAASVFSKCRLFAVCLHAGILSLPRPNTTNAKTKSEIFSDGETSLIDALLQSD